VAWFVTGIRQEGARLARKREILRQRELLILNAPAEEDGEDMLYLLAAHSDTASEAEYHVFLETALSLLTPKQRTVIIATVIQGVPEHVLAEQLGITQQAVHRLKSRALKRLRTCLIAEHAPS
jgi:RNA polymerase sigma factor (sigma-70 family)